MTTMYYNYGSRSPEAHGGASNCLAWSRKNVAMLLLAIATTNVNFAVAGSGPLMASGGGKQGPIEEVPLWEAGFKVVGCKGNGAVPFLLVF